MPMKVSPSSDDRVEPDNELTGRDATLVSHNLFHPCQRLLMRQPSPSLRSGSNRTKPCIKGGRLRRALRRGWCYARSATARCRARRQGRAHAKSTIADVCALTPGAIWEGRFAITSPSARTRSIRLSGAKSSACLKTQVSSRPNSSPSLIKNKNAPFIFGWLKPSPGFSPDSAHRQKNLDVQQRQRNVRLLVKDVLVGDDEILIRHSIPVPGNPSNDASSPSITDGGSSGTKSYLLRSGQGDAAMRGAGDRVVEHRLFKLARSQPLLEDGLVHGDMVD